ncbi:hypothetical protein ES705_45605 [subsurface metagenome]
MKCAQVITILEDLSRNPEQALDIDQVHALIFAVAIIHAMPENQTNLVDILFDLSFPDPYRIGSG